MDILNAPVTVVGEQIPGQAATALEQLEQLIAESNKIGFDIGEKSYNVKKNGYYTVKYTTFQDFLKTLPYKKRRIEYLTKMFEVMDSVGIARSKFESLGLSKMREITSLDPNSDWVNPETQAVTPMREFIIGFVEKGNELTLQEIQQHVRTLKGLVGENDFVFRKLAFTRADAEATWDPAIALAKNNIGSVGKDDEGISIDASDSAAAKVLAIEYLADPANNVLSE